MNYYGNNTYYNTDISHFGILGMKWGVRRYQNKDGSLTNAGKKQKVKSSKDMTDDELISSIKRKSLESTYDRQNKQNKQKSKLQLTKDIFDLSSQATNQLRNINQRSRPSKKRMNLSKMTDQQLRDKINRENLERQYNDLFSSEETISKGKRIVSSILDNAGTVLSVGASSLGIALAIKEFKN